MEETEQQQNATETTESEAYTTRPLDKKLDILDKMFAKHPRRKARYFLVVGEWGPEKKTCVVHIESGAWISLENSFDETLERLEDKPDADAPLLSAILTTRTMALENAVRMSEESAHMDEEPTPFGENCEANSLTVIDPDEVCCESKCETSCSAETP